MGDTCPLFGACGGYLSTFITGARLMRGSEEIRKEQIEPEGEISR